MTSAITESRTSATRLSARHLRAYTLSEMLVVVGVIALVTGMAVPMMMPFLRNRSLKAGVELVKAACIRARTLAITQRKGFDVVFNEKERTITVREHRDSAPFAEPEGKVLELPENTWLDANGDNNYNGGSYFFYFTPTGGIRNDTSSPVGQGSGQPPRVRVANSAVPTDPTRKAFVITFYPTTGQVFFAEE